MVSSDLEINVFLVRNEVGIDFIGALDGVGLILKRDSGRVKLIFNFGVWLVTELVTNCAGMNGTVDKCTFISNRRGFIMFMR